MEMIQFTIRNSKASMMNNKYIALLKRGKVDGEEKLQTWCCLNI